MKLKKWKISRFWCRIRIRRKYKDRLFQKVFEDKKDLLELYNVSKRSGYRNDCQKYKHSAGKDTGNHRKRIKR